MAILGKPRKHWLLHRHQAIATLIGLTASFTGLLFPAMQTASADSLSGAKAQAARISAQIQADTTRLDEAGTEYGIAQQQLTQLDDQMTKTRADIVRTDKRMETARSRLRKIAVDAYVTGGSVTRLNVLFSGNVSEVTAGQEYASVASSNVSRVIDDFLRAKASLAAQQRQLGVARTQAQTAVGQTASAQQAAQQAEANQQATLGQVNGQIASLIQQQQQAKARAEHAAFIARIQAERAAQAAQSTPAVTAVSTTVPVAVNSAPASGVASGNGANGAVQAAESQVGVPYQWGGESPGVGLDCSGLTQWSWAQAGVNIPRVAADQYAAIAHVPLDQIQPGDLIFWNDGTSSIQHVAIYVGNGDVITAPETGQTVRVEPIWNDGLVGAGRP